MAVFRERERDREIHYVLHVLHASAVQEGKMPSSRGDILYIEGGLSGTWHERSLVTEWEKLANAHKQ